MILVVSCLLFALHTVSLVRVPYGSLTRFSAGSSASHVTCRPMMSRLPLSRRGGWIVFMALPAIRAHIWTDPSDVQAGLQSSLNRLRASSTRRSGAADPGRRRRGPLAARR